MLGFLTSRLTGSIGGSWSAGIPEKTVNSAFGRFLRQHYLNERFEVSSAQEDCLPLDHPVAAGFYAGCAIVLEIPPGSIKFSANLFAAVTNSIPLPAAFDLPLGMVN